MPRCQAMAWIDVVTILMGGAKQEVSFCESFAAHPLLVSLPSPA